MDYLAVKHFEQFQHYKDRSPQWIKLYTSVLEDYEFLSLSDVERAHIMLIWALASRLDNKIPFDDRWVSNTIHASKKVNLRRFVELGWLEPWSANAAVGKREEWASRYIPDSVREEVLERDGRQCVECHSGELLEIDHVIPISRGGAGDRANLQTLCRSCNRKKRNRLTKEAENATQDSESAEQPATQESESAEPRGRPRSRGEGEEEKREREIRTTSSAAPAEFGELTDRIPASHHADLRDLLARVPNATVWAAEMGAALDGMPGHHPITPPQLAQAVRDFNGNAAKPNLAHFRGYLRNAAVPDRPVVPAGSRRTTNASRFAPASDTTKAIIADMIAGKS